MKRLVPLLLTGVGLALCVSQAQAVTPTTVSGTFTFTGDIYVHTAIPENYVVYCEVTLSVVLDANGTNSEIAYVPATLKSGTTYTCSVPIHYYWHLDTPATDELSVSWALGIGPTTGLTSTSQLVRTGGHTLPPITSGVPASGTSWGLSDDAAL